MLAFLGLPKSCIITPEAKRAGSASWDVFLMRNAEEGQT